MAKPVHWSDIQQNTFTRWCNDELQKRGYHIKDLKNDLKDGVLLINLMEVISGKSLGRWNKYPRVISQKLENINIALKFIKDEGLRLVNVGADDIHEGNLRIILGLIWTLILRYEIKSGKDDKDATNDLLKWVQSKIPDYNIQGFTKDWNDGRAVCALVNALRPNLCTEHKSMNPANALDNATLGIDTAMKNMGVDKLIYPEEMIHPKVDKLAMMTYIAQFRNLMDVGDEYNVRAFGPGLVEGVQNTPTGFGIQAAQGLKGKLDVKVEGPQNDAKVDVKEMGPNEWAVHYTPTVPGTWKVHVKWNDKHIPGSIFTVHVTETESIGGQGMIFVFYSTTSGTDKGRRDFYNLQNMFQNKKVHLRPNFEPWIAVDLMDKDDREAVFRKAGTRTLPIVFVDDKYVGDYDKIVELNEVGKLDEILDIQHVKGLLTEEEHLQRLKAMAPDAKREEKEVEKGVQKLNIHN